MTTDIAARPRAGASAASPAALGLRPPRLSKESDAVGRNACRFFTSPILQETSVVYQMLKLRLWTIGELGGLKLPRRTDQNSHGF